MRRILSVVLAVAVVGFLASVAFAQMGGPGWRGMGPGMMGGGMGPGMMGGGMGPGGQAGQGTCPGWAAAGGQTEAAQITADKAKELAQQYADEFLKGFTVERVLPFTMGRGTMYSVELKGPEGQVRTFHVNPWGTVMPFGAAQRRAG